MAILRHIWLDPPELDYSSRIATSIRSFRSVAVAYPRNRAAKVDALWAAANSWRLCFSSNAPIASVAQVGGRWRAKKMNVIRHDDISTDMP